MKILYFINHITNNGGIERIIFDKINYLQREKGYTIYLAYYGELDDKPFYQLDHRIIKIPIPLNIDSSSFKNKICNVIKAIPHIFSIIKQSRPDIIISANTILITWILPFIQKKIPKILELHFSYEGIIIMNEEIHNNKIKSKLLSIARKLIYPLYDKIIVLTQKDKALWKFKNIEVIPNFTSLEFSGQTSMKELKAICVGRLEMQKDLPILIKAWEIVAKRFPNWTLEIWGKGSMEDKLKDEITLLGLEKKVFLKGVSKDIEKVFLTSSVFILPSLYEGFPIVLIEAAKAGLPCLGFDITGNDEIIKDGINGYLIKERNYQVLSEYIIKTISNPDKMDRMGKESLKISKSFDKERIMSSWIELFEHLIKINKHL